MSLHLNFDNTYRHLSKDFFTLAKGHRTPKADFAIFNSELAQTLGLNPDTLESTEGAQVLSGNSIPSEAAGIAMAYAGHQFGHFTMLGDGRALLLGELLTSENKRFDIHLKGSGATAYSRNGDGKAALGPMLREYLISEAMYALGIPTSRSLSVVTTGEEIFRERPLQGAVLSRIAASHIRVGTFQYAAALSLESPDCPSLVKELADYSLSRHYPHLLEVENPHLALYEAILSNQSQLVAKWQAVGFIHGVLNTDNTAISGETIDYGPCAFMGTYHPRTVFSSIDHQGRYAYHNQPNIIGWNLARLAEAIMPLFADNLQQAKAMAEKAIQGYVQQYEKTYCELFCAKLGISASPADSTESKQCVDQFLKILADHHLDFTQSFMWLTLKANNDSRLSELDELHKPLTDWIDKWQALRSGGDFDIKEANERMYQVNP